MQHRREVLAGAGAFAAFGCQTSPPRIQLRSSDAGTLAEAIAALPPEGGEIALEPGVYRAKLVIDKPNVRLIGLGARPDDVVLVWGDGAKYAGGTGQSYSVKVTGSGMSMDARLNLVDLGALSGNERADVNALLDIRAFSSQMENDVFQITEQTPAISTVTLLANPLGAKVPV